MANSEKPRLKNYYEKEIVPQLMKDFSLTNIMKVPKLKKIVLNVGLGEAIQNPKAMESTVESMTQIAGQKPVITKSKKAIATFKLREDMPIGCMVTLRKDRMWEFLDRFFNIALPRVRDFRGITSKFDSAGNCSVGITEQIIFPEVDYDKIDKIRGMNITFVTSAPGAELGKALLKSLGMPFKN